MERLVYGAALAAGLTGLVVAIYPLFGDQDQAQTADPLLEQALAAPQALAPAPGHAPDLVPDLPEVPNLAIERPNGRPVHEPQADEDGRLAQLGLEMRLLSRAQELLAEHPAEAMGSLEQHQRRYPMGALREEREAFAIEAMVALGRLDDAERRYFDFRSDFPESSFTERLNERLRAER